MEKVNERRVGTLLAATYTVTPDDVGVFRAHAQLHTGLTKPSEATRAANGDTIEIYIASLNEQRYELEYHPSARKLEVVTDPAIPFTTS